MRDQQAAILNKLEQMQFADGGFPEAGIRTVTSPNTLRARTVIFPIQKPTSRVVVCL